MLAGLASLYMLGLVLLFLLDNGLFIVVRALVKVGSLDVAYAIGIGSPSMVSGVELAGLDEILNVVFGLAPVALSVAPLLGFVGVLILVAMLGKVLGEAALGVGHVDGGGGGVDGWVFVWVIERVESDAVLGDSETPIYTVSALWTRPWLSPDVSKNSVCTTL